MIDRLTELILDYSRRWGKQNSSPRGNLHIFESLKPYSDNIIEKHFDRKTIRILLWKDENSKFNLLPLKYKFAEDKSFAVQFNKKYFSKEEFENMLKKDDLTSLKK